MLISMMAVLLNEQCHELNNRQMMMKQHLVKFLVNKPLLQSCGKVCTHAHRLHQDSQDTVQLLASLQHVADHPSQTQLPGFPLRALCEAEQQFPAAPLCLEPWDTGAPLPLHAVGWFGSA